MAFARRALEPGLRGAEVGSDPAAEAIRLAEVEHRIGVAGFGERPPDIRGGGIIGALPRLDAGLDALRVSGARDT